MIDIKFLRENPDAVKENIKKKFQDSKLPLVDEVIELDLERRKTLQRAEALRADKNRISKEIGKFMANGQKDDAEKAKAQVAEFAKELAEKLKGKPSSVCAEELVEAERQLNIYFRDAVDEVFGEGTCRKVYGDILPSIEMHMQFFDALRPYFEEEAKRRQARMNKYNAGRMGNAINIKHNS